MFYNLFIWFFITFLHNLYQNISSFIKADEKTIKNKTKLGVKNYFFK